MGRSFAGVVDDGRLKLAGGDPIARIAVLLDGELTNAESLARELALAADASAADVVRSGFQRWGDGILARLRGRFAVLLWDPDLNDGLIAVDQLGAGSLFYFESSDRLFFGSELRDLLAVLPSTPGPDELAVAQWLAEGALQRGRTLYAGVRRLTGGSVLRIGRFGWHIDTYWTPRYAAPLAGSRSELASQLRGEIERAVHARIAGNDIVGTLLSGGLDSSVIAAVAARSGRSAAYSMTFPSHPSVDESPYIAAVATSLGIESRRADVSAGSLIEPAAEFLTEWHWPSVSPALMPNLAVARLAVGEGVTVLFDGEDGDELFGAAPYLIADALRAGRVPTALRLAAQFAGVGDHPPAGLTRWILREYGVKGSAPRSFHRAVRRVRGVRRYALPWLTGRTQRMLGEADDTWDWKVAHAGPRWWANRVERVTAWRECLGAHDYLRRKAALAGVRDAHPFLDDLDLIELVLRIPPEYAFDARLSRPLLREAMKGLLPDEVRLRPHKATFNEFVEACLDGPDRPTLEQVILSPNAEIRAFVHQDVIRDLFFGRGTDRRPLGWAGIVWQLVTAECWLQRNAASAAPRRLAESQPA